MNLKTLTENVINIHQTLQSSAANAINRLLTMRNWLIGYYIVEYEQKGEDRAKYGDKVISNLATNLNQVEGFSQRNLKLYRQFFLSYPQLSDPIFLYLKNNSITGQSLIAQSHNFSNSINEIGQSLIAQSKPASLIPPDKLFKNLAYTHFIQLLPIEEPIKRTFYELECIKGNWSVRELKRQINSLYFERSGLSKKPDKLSEIVQKQIDPQEPKDIIKNIYTFEFLGLPLKDVVEESDFETALLNHLQEFLIELGHGFCFEARQKRILIGDEYYFIDLVFYHRILKCHVLVDLKVEEFKHSNVGQLNTYLNYYKDVIVQPSDNPPVGILLVTDKNDALVQYATAGMNENLFVQKYLLELPSKQQLENYILKELPNLT
jgi:predicted nuclease of restriction endonuclease-like (RecB) superfamily